jgi:Rrf2 family protein
MLTLTKKSEYALTAMCHLATRPKETVSARDIAQTNAVPLPLLMNVLKLLNQAGYVNSTRGARGGYSLAVDARDVSLNDLLVAIEGPVRLVPCASPAQNASERLASATCENSSTSDAAGNRTLDGCAREAVCTIRRPLHRVHEAFTKFLEAVTIADLAFDSQPIDLKIANLTEKVSA